MKSTLLLVAAASLFLVFVARVWISTRQSEEQGIGSFSGVSKITGDLVEKGYAPRKFTKLEVPKRYYYLFKDILRNPSKIKKEGIGRIIARFDFHFNDGTTRKLDICFSGKAPISFFLDGMPYERSGPYKSTEGDWGYVDESIVFCTIMGEISFEMEKGTRSDILNRFLRLWNSKEK